MQRLLRNTVKIYAFIFLFTDQIVFYCLIIIYSTDSNLWKFLNLLGIITDLFTPKATAVKFKKGILSTAALKDIDPIQGLANSTSLVPNPQHYIRYTAILVRLPRMLAICNSVDKLSEPYLLKLNERAPKFIHFSYLTTDLRRMNVWVWDINSSPSIWTSYLLHGHVWVNTHNRIRIPLLCLNQIS